MASQLEAASGMVINWLEGEYHYQFGPNSDAQTTNPHTRIDAIMETELSDHWNSFQFYRRNNENFHNPKLTLRAGQQIMKAAGAAQSALILDSIRYHHPILRAKQSSIGVLKDHLKDVSIAAAELPPPDLLDAPFADAIDPYSTTPIPGSFGHQYQTFPIFSKLAGHAINYLLEQASDTGTMTLPKPGVPSGVIQPWKRIFSPQV